MNVWNFTGHLGRDAEQRFTPSGDSIVGFTVAVKSGFGERESTTWARCSMFGKRGESVLLYLNKGQLVGISGEMTAREWTNREGITQTSIEVRVSDLTLLGRRDDAQQNQPRQHPAQQQAPAQNQYAQASGGGLVDLNDDIPFAQAYGRKSHYF